MNRSDRKNLEASVIIVALGIMYFVGPFLIWGDKGIAIATLLFLGAITLASLIGLVFCALNDTPGMGKSAPPMPPMPAHRSEDDD